MATLADVLDHFERHRGHFGNCNDLIAAVKETQEQLAEARDDIARLERYGDRLVEEKTGSFDRIQEAMNDSGEISGQLIELHAEFGESWAQDGERLLWLAEYAYDLSAELVGEGFMQYFPWKLAPIVRGQGLGDTVKLTGDIRAGIDFAREIDAAREEEPDGP